jgi:hypothetical protein
MAPFPVPPATLTQANYVVSPMPAVQSEGNTVYVSQNAAGQGSPIVPAPAADAEFPRLESGSSLPAIDSRAVDYLAGLDDSDFSPADLLSGTLPTGVVIRHEG